MIEIKMLLFLVALLVVIFAIRIILDVKNYKQKKSNQHVQRLEIFAATYKKYHLEKPKEKVMLMKALMEFCERNLPHIKTIEIDLQVILGPYLSKKNPDNSPKCEVIPLHPKEKQ